MLSKAGAILFIPFLDLLINTTLNTDTRSVIEITGFRALEPNVFSIF